MATLVDRKRKPGPDDRGRVDRELRRLGFGGLDDPNLIASIAFFIKSHEQFRGQLFSVLPEQRRHAYEVLRPHLKFVAKPLDVYEAEMKEMAERQQLPGYDDATGQLVPFKAGSVELDLLATEAIRQEKHEKGGGQLEMVCRKCTKAQYFAAKLRKEAEKQAKDRGWRSDGQHCYCPEHVPGRATMTLHCTGGTDETPCTRVERIRAWDQQDGYAAARLQGWYIGDSALCPACNLRTAVTLQ